MIKHHSLIQRTKILHALLPWLPRHTPLNYNTNWNANSMYASTTVPLIDEAKLVFLSYELKYVMAKIGPYIKLKLLKSCI